MYLLDAGTCFALLRGSNAVRARIRAQDPTSLRLSALVKAELLQAARTDDHVAARLDLLQRFFEPFTSLAFDDRSAEQYALLRAQASEESSLEAADLMLAAVALAHDATLVTTRPAELSLVPGLPVEDWTRD